MTLPVYFVQPGPPPDGVEAALPEGAVRLESLQALRSVDPSDEGVLVLGPDLPPGDLADALEEWALPGNGWLVLRVRPDGDSGLDIRPLSLGYPVRPEDLEARARGGRPERAILDLDGLLHAFSRARHDLNNPLTSAMAEAQLLLLDAEDPEIRSSLESIERQLRRIRDLIHDLSVYRAPPDE